MATSTPSSDLRFGRFRFEVGEGRLSADGCPIAAQPQVLELLRLLVERRGRLVTREEIHDALWPGLFVGDEALTQTIKRLRATLGDDPKAPRFIETIPRKGYRFIGEAEADIGPAASRPARRRPIWLLVGMIAVATAGLATLAVSARRQRLPPPILGQVLTQRRLAATAERESDPALSRDGREMVFAANPNGDLDLYISRLDDPARMALTATPDADEFGPRFSPDGAWIGLTRQQGSTVTAMALSRFGGRERVLQANARFQDFAPDGESFLVSEDSARGGTRLLRIESPPLAGRHLLFESAGEIESAGFSPDGRSIAFADGSRIYRLPSSGGEPRTLGPPSESARSLAWDPLGHGVFREATWNEGRTNLWWVPGGGGEPLAVTRGGSGLFQPEPTPDGRSLVFVEESKTRRIWSLGADGRAVSALDAPTSVECFDVAESGDALWLSDADPESGQDSIVRLRVGDAQGPGRVAIAAGLCPAVSGDGKSLVAWGSTRETAGLWLHRLDTEQRTLLLPAPDSGDSPKANLHLQAALSRDGATVLLPTPAGLLPPGLLELSAEPLPEAREPRWLLEGRFGPPSLSPDETRVAVTGRGPAGEGLYRVGLRDGSAVRLGPWRSYRSPPIWSADGRRLFVLVDERRAPRLVEVDAESGAVVGELPLRLPADPAFWGVFVVRRDPRGGWWALVERYEADLVQLSSSSKAVAGRP